MYGWRCRIGLIIPSDNTVMESEFNKVLYNLDGISVHATRIFLETLTIESLLKMEEELERAARELKTAEVDIIAFGCTTGSLIKGKGYDKKIIDIIESITKTKVTTTTTAVLCALEELGVEKIAVGTPYSDEINEKVKRFLEDNGFRVVNILGLNIVPDVDIGKQCPSVAYKLGKKVNTNDAEAIFLSCTDLRTFEILDILEKDLKKPVISSNQATLWHILKLMRVGTSIKGYGSLLESYLGVN